MFATIEPEANVLTQQALEYLMFKGVYAWRQNNGNKLGRRNIDKKGVGDIVGLTRDGRHLELEIKVGKDKQSEDQIKHEKNITERGGIYKVIRKFEDLEGLEL